MNGFVLTFRYARKHNMFVFWDNYDKKYSVAKFKKYGLTDKEKELITPKRLTKTPAAI